MIVLRETPPFRAGRDVVYIVLGAVESVVKTRYMGM
jgi:hypothetical protein